MSVYLIVNGSITNPDSMAEYLAAVGDTLKGHAAEVLVSTRAAETIEGQPVGPRVVMMKFPDREAFHAWYDSPEYQAIVGLRLRGTDGFAVLAEGRDAK